MGPLQSMVLALGLLLPATDPPAASDVALLEEMLYNRRHPLSQSQAALLLLESDAREAQELIRKELRQTNNADVFAALAAAVSLHRDRRFVEELFERLNGGSPPIRQATAEALAELADSALVRRLQALVEDDHTERALRQTALWTLGHCGQKAAVVVLLDQLSNSDEALRQAAADALAQMTGLNYGVEVARWGQWWNKHKDLPNERWLEERLAYESGRARRIEGEMERARAQIVSLHQQLYSRMPAADRLGHVALLADAEDPSVRSLAVAWCVELWPTADIVGQHALADLLIRASHDGNLEAQRNAVLALGRINDARVGDRLLHLLQRGAPGIRAAAARALAQQAAGSGTEAVARQKQVVPALQRALDDPALEVVAEAAESLGTLGVPEAGPVLAALLRHPSGQVRQTAALALERVADQTIVTALIDALEDSLATVRFSLVGALGRAARAGSSLTEAQKSRVLARLEDLLIKDADPGVRSRAATVLGECGTPAQLPTLWRRVLSTEENRVQEKAWSGFVEILVRSGNRDLFMQWQQTLADAKQPVRRIQLLTEIAARWQQAKDLRPAAAASQEMLVQAHLDQGKWAAAFAVLRDLLAQSTAEPDVDPRLAWLQQIAEMALKDGSGVEALRAVKDARVLLARRPGRTTVFDDLEKQAKQLPAPKGE